MGYENYDFSGYATRFDIKCSDGRIIRHGAFKDQNGAKIPLVWNHQHHDPEMVLGHGYLEHRDDGEYIYGYFNDTERAEQVKKMLQHNDIEGLSIWANKLKEMGNDVVHGVIREVSLVLAGANPGATIDTVLAHSEDSDSEELFVYNHEPENFSVGCPEPVIEHADSDEGSKSEKGETKMASERTVSDVIDSMNEEQQAVVAYLLTQATETNEKSKEDDEVKHNVFDQDENHIAHSEIDFEAVKSDAKKLGSFKDAFLAHANDEDVDPYSPVTYGVEHLNYLFPEATELNTPPEFIKRDTDWVAKVMNGVKKSPFSRVKTTFADITADDARAKGYIRGHMKKEEFFTLLKRTTEPTTIYKKQKMDRDDVIDITSFDVIAWIKGEMRLMLDEEIARAILVGDGRLTSSDEHINEQNIRPIISDADLYTIKSKVTVKYKEDDDDVAKANIRAKAFIRQAIKARKDYKGSGSPVLYTTTDLLTDMLLLEDGMGRPMYDTEAKLATALRVSAIVEVPVMEGQTVEIKTTEGGTTTTTTYPLMGVIVNLKDYNVGADKGGAIAMFDDFDIDYNQMKYLIETRCSGALIKPYSAIDLLLEEVEDDGEEGGEG